MRPVISFLAVALFSFSAVAEQVCSATATKTALIVFDMQPYFAERRENHRTPPNPEKIRKLKDAQLKAIAEAKKRNIPIIFIEYYADGYSFGTTDTELKDSVRSYASTRTFRKTTDGMFSTGNEYRDQLVKYLKEQQVANLVITGANGGACVLESIEGSLESNCNVTAYTDGIADFNYNEFIYPYKNYYNGKSDSDEALYYRIRMDRITCETCHFNETDSLRKVTDVMEAGMPRTLPANSQRPAATKATR